MDCLFKMCGKQFILVCMAYSGQSLKKKQWYKPSEFKLKSTTWVISAKPIESSMVKSITLSNKNDTLIIYGIHFDNKWLVLSLLYQNDDKGIFRSSVYAPIIKLICYFFRVFLLLKVVFSKTEITSHSEQFTSVWCVNTERLDLDFAVSRTSTCNSGYYAQCLIC